MPVDVSSSLPELDLAAGATVTVTVDDPAAILTVLVVHGAQVLQEAGAAIPPPTLVGQSGPV